MLDLSRPDNITLTFYDRENMPEVDVRKEAFATSFPNMAEVKNGTDILNGQSDRSEAEQKLIGLFGMAAGNKDEDAPK